VVGQDREPAPPIARMDTLHGEIRVDPYFWLRDDRRSAPEVIGYLEAENGYTDAKEMAFRYAFVLDQVKIAIP
jgi:protease II